MKMFIAISIVVVFLGCKHRDATKSVALELQLILGEPVVCYQIYDSSGYLCRTDSIGTRRHYYCPNDRDIACFFTNRIQLLDPPAEAPPL